MRDLCVKFTDPEPTVALYAARELFLIYQDQLITLAPAPTVQWKSAIDSEQLTLDAAALASVFKELLENAQAFGSGSPLTGSAHTGEGHVIFELREPKLAEIDIGSWGREPFTTTRAGHQGLGLWHAQRVVTANGGKIEWSFLEDTMELVTSLRFPVADSILHARCPAPHDQRDHEQDEENQEEDFREANRGTGDCGEAEETGNDCENKKGNSPG
jgi:hypothetical protein